MKPLVEYIGKPARLEQTAEECLELFFACLKLARYMRDENKVYGRSNSDMIKAIEEEIADVQITIHELYTANIVSFDNVTDWKIKKLNRMDDRFSKEANNDKN